MPTTIDFPQHSATHAARIGPFQSISGTTPGPTATDDRIFVRLAVTDAFGNVWYPLSGESPNLLGGTAFTIVMGPFIHIFPDTSYLVADGTSVDVQIAVVHSPYTSVSYTVTISGEFVYDHIGRSWSQLGSQFGSLLGQILAAVQTTFPRTS